MRGWIGCLALATLLAAGTASAREAADLKVDRVVLLMRHGVRPPTKSPPMPAGTAADAWPGWSVAPGELTLHGAQAVRRIGDFDRARLVRWGLLSKTGCPAKGVVRIVSDSDQRTIATGDALAASLAPGCAVDHVHRAQGQPDPLFDSTPEDADAARAAVLAALGPDGVAGEERRMMPLLKRIDAILCGSAKTACGLPAEPSALAPATPGSKPKLTGRLDRASTLAQILLLEYADGKPMREVGWGRATAADVTALSAFHALEYRILARTPYQSRHQAGNVARLMRDAVAAPNGAAITVIVGHDTQVGALGGLLDLHWKIAGIATDDPSPGGALGFERLVARDGSRYVRAVMRAQSLEQIRAAAPIAANDPGIVSVLPLPGCHARGQAGLCTLDQFTKLVDTRLAGSQQSSRSASSSSEPTDQSQSCAASASGAVRPPYSLGRWT